MNSNNNTNLSGIETFNNIYFSLAVLILCFGGLYHHVIIKMVIDWSQNDNYSHGFLIPFISVFFIWHNREKLSKIPIFPSRAGLLLLLSGLSLFVVAYLGAELFTMRFSMLMVLFGLVVYFGGWEFGKALFLPVGYLIFMIPLPGIIWNKIAFPLKLFATKISATVIQWLGIVVYREGNIIHLADTTLEVVDACSGLRSLTSLLALSAAFALINHHSKTKKWILFLSAVPIAILVNIIRLTVTAMLSEYFGEQVALGFLHEASGILVFILALVILYAVYALLERLSSNISTTN